MIVPEEKLQDLIKFETELSLSNKRAVPKRDLSYIIKNAVFYLIKKIYAGSPLKSIKNTSSIKRFALIRNDAIGDYIVSTGAIKLIRNVYPDAQIDIFASSKNINLIKHDPLIDNAYLCDYKSISDIDKKMLKDIANNTKYNYVICLNNSRTTVNAVISSIIGKYAEKVIPLFPARKEIYWKVFTKQIDIDDPNLTWSERMTKLVAVAINAGNSSPVLPYIFINKESYNNIYKFNESAGLKFKIKSDNIIRKENFEVNELDGSSYTVVNISAGKESNTWSSEKCLEFLNKYFEKEPDKIVYLSSSPSDYDRCEEIVKAINKPNCRFFKAGLLDFIAFLSCADLLISPDTGVVHIAACADVPTVILYPALFHLVYWRPNTNRRIMILSNDNKSVNTVEINEIIEAIDIINHQDNKK